MGHGSVLSLPMRVDVAGPARHCFANVKRVLELVPNVWVLGRHLLQRPLQRLEFVLSLLPPALELLLLLIDAIPEFPLKRNLLKFLLFSIFLVPADQLQLLSRITSECTCTLCGSSHF